MRLAALFALLALALAQDINPVDNLRDKFYKLEHGLWQNVTDPEWTNINSDFAGDVKLTKAFADFNDQMQGLPAVPRPASSSWLWQKISGKLVVIDGLYENFVRFCTRQATPGGVAAPVKEWLDLAESILLDPEASVARTVKELHELMKHYDLFRNVLQEQGRDVCELEMSPHQLVYDMYNTIALTEIKGYAMMQFSWMLLRIYGKGNYTQEASLTRHRYSERTSRAAAEARSALSLASRDLYRCDPPVHQEGKTYEQVTRLLQGYIENEVDMNPDRTCRENCAFYSLTKNYGCFADQYCEQQKTCKGRIIGCGYVDSDMWVCPASSNSNRRYDWIEFENGRTYGKAGSCMRGSTKVDSWWRWLFWHCSYCLCLCDDSDNSDRYFSLRQETSDVKNNKVVTGLRMVKHGKVFHLQIHQATLGERGAVSQGEWVPVQKFDPFDTDVVNGVDFHTLSYERRAIDLDDLESPARHCLTGARFRMIGAHLHFEIRSTPFNYTTGRLSPDRSQWISNDNTEGALDRPREKLPLIAPDIPTRSHSPLPVVSNHDQYLEFTHTDFDADAAQSTVPFVDIQPVLPSKGGALASGAGIIHRGGRSSGGFIAIKLITYNFAEHVSAAPPPADITEENSRPALPEAN